MVTIFFMLATVTFACSACLSVLARRWAPRLGYVDHPGQRKIHRAPVPYGGGVAVYLSVLAGLAFVALAAWAYGAGDEQLGSEAGPTVYFGQIWMALTTNGSRLPIILGCATLLFLIGLVDDRWGLSAEVKLFSQLVVALLLFRQGIAITAFLGWWGASLALTVLWVVGLTNAFNFSDNMDGLCAGLACVSGAIFFTVAVQTQQLSVAAMLALLVGAVAGFLVFNYPKASIFLGDAGSLLIGFLLATLAIEFEFYSSADPDRYRIFQFAYWSPNDPKAYGYKCCLISGSEPSHHGQALITLGKLLDSTRVVPYISWRTDPVLHTELSERQSSIEGFLAGRRIVLAVHLMKNNVSALFTDWNRTMDSMHLNWPSTTITVWLPTISPTQVKSAYRVGIYGSRLPLTISSDRDGIRLEVPVCDPDDAEQRDNRNTPATTFYVSIER